MEWVDACFLENTQQRSGNSEAATAKRQQRSGNSEAATAKRQQRSGNSEAAIAKRLKLYEAVEKCSLSCGRNRDIVHSAGGAGG